MFYEFHEPSKLGHDSSKPNWHVEHINFMIVDISMNFMDLSNQFHESLCTLWFSYFKTLNFSPSRFTFFAFSLIIDSSLFYVYMEASSLDADFSLVFHYSTGNLEVRCVGSFSHPPCMTSFKSSPSRSPLLPTICIPWVFLFILGWKLKWLPQSYVVGCTCMWAKKGLGQGHHLVIDNN